MFFAALFMNVIMSLITPIAPMDNGAGFDRTPGELTPPSQPIHRPGGFNPGRPTAHR